ncbi:unnamed protein product [Malus baccata var. baccata]
MKEELLLQYFYEELLPIERQMLDASAGRALVDKTPMAAKTLIANRALNAQQYEGVGQRDNPQQQQVNEVVEKPKEQSVAACGVCSMNGHLTDKCPQLIENGGWESANAVGFGSQNQPRNDPLERSSKFQMEGALTNPTTTSGILSKAVCTLTTPNTTPKGGFKSVKAITLQSGQEVGYDPSPFKSNQKEDEKLQSEEKEQGLPSTRIKQSLLQPPTHPNSTTKGKLGSNSMTSNSIPTNAPFPHRFMQPKKDESDKDILDTFRKVQVNIPLLNAIKQVPKYAKFLKELCTTRKMASNKEVVRVNHLVFSADFYMLEMEYSNHSFQLPILLGRSFMKTTRTKIDVFKGTLTMEFDGEVIDFNISDAMRYPHDGHSCFSIDVIDSWVQEFLDDLNEDALEKILTQSIGLKNEGLSLRHAHDNNKEHLVVPIQEELVEMVAALELNPRHIGKSPNLISIPIATNKLLPSVIQPPSLELKPLPSHLKYVFLGEQETLPVIISSSLTAQEEDKLVRVLREYRTAIGWTLVDIKGISLTTCMHRILLEEGAKPSRET